MSLDELKPTILDASGWSGDVIEQRLGDKLLVQPREVAHVTFLDTFDWRIHGFGGELTARTTGGRTTLGWAAEGELPYALPIREFPRLAADIPPGFLHDLLEPVIEVRALLPMGSYRSDVKPMRVVDENGNIRARLELEEWVAVDRDGREHGDVRRHLTVRPVPGQAQVAAALLETLKDGGIGPEIAFDSAREAASAIGRRPGDYNSKPSFALDGKQPAGEAVRSILRALLDTIEANVAGVIDDVDIEFLHDLRVATRRTRSALGQIKGALPAGTVERFGSEFKWLGQLTGPCRDLDVYLLEMETFRRQLGTDGGVLEPLERILRRARRNELRRVRRALLSARFARLTAAWRDALDERGETDGDAPDASRPIVAVAGDRTLRAYRRMVKRGSKLGDDPPAELLHRLRIDAKKLRYLLEFFHNLYDRTAVGRLVKELKQLQDILGGFNDMEVQRHRLHEFADRMIEERLADSEALFAMGRLASIMQERQDDYHDRFGERFAAFADDDSARLYRRLFGGERS